MSGWRIKGTAGPLANQAFPLGERLNFVRTDEGGIAVAAQPDGTLLAVLTLSDGAAPSLERATEDVTLQVNGADWTGGPLQIGDEIRLGSHRFLLQAPGLRPDRVLAPERAAQGGRKWRWLVLAAALAAAAALTAWWLMR